MSLKTTHEASLALRREFRRTNTLARARLTPTPRRKPRRVSRDSKELHPSRQMPTLADPKKMPKRSTATSNPPPKILCANSASLLATISRIFPMSLAKEPLGYKAPSVTTSAASFFLFFLLQNKNFVLYTRKRPFCFWHEYALEVQPFPPPFLLSSFFISCFSSSFFVCFWS